MSGLRDRGDDGKDNDMKRAKAAVRDAKPRSVSRLAQSQLVVLSDNPAFERHPGDDMDDIDDTQQVIYTAV
jgi:hypothetical protein